MYPTPASRHRLSLGTQECRHHFAALADGKVKDRAGEEEGGGRCHLSGSAMRTMLRQGRKIHQKVALSSSRCRARDSNNWFLKSLCLTLGRRKTKTAYKPRNPGLQNVSRPTLAVFFPHSHPRIIRLTWKSVKKQKKKSKNKNTTRTSKLAIPKNKTKNKALYCF